MLEPNTLLAQLWNNQGPDVDVMTGHLDSLSAEIQDKEMIYQ